MLEDAPAFETLLSILDTISTASSNMLSQVTLLTLLAASAVATPIFGQRSSNKSSNKSPNKYSSQGCGIAQSPGYDSTPRTIVSGGHTRSFTIQVPANYNDYGSSPLILDFGKSLIVRSTPGILASANHLRSTYRSVSCPHVLRWAAAASFDRRQQSMSIDLRLATPFSNNGR